jgi:hypothetical protein
MDVLWLLAAFPALVLLGGVAALLIGPVPQRRPPTAPPGTGDFEIWPFF